MDPITAAILTATVVPLANGVAGEAGKQAWGSLTSFVRTRLGRGSAADVALQTLADHPEQAVPGEVLGQVLERSAEQDEQVAAWIREWLRTAAPLAGQAPAPSISTNTISGDARVGGPVVQAHTIVGPITFGLPPTPPPTPPSEPDGAR